MTIIQTTKALQPRHLHDFYETPVELCREAIARVSNMPMKVLDPGTGTGNWGKALRDRYKKMYSLAEEHNISLKSMKIVGIDIREIEKPDSYDELILGDFLTYDFKDEKFDAIIGNPPYKHAEEFVRKSLTLLESYGILAFLLPLSFLESEKRYKGLWQEFKPVSVQVSTRRVSFSGNKKADNTAYAMYYWREGMMDMGTNLSWLDWRYDA